MKLKPYPAYKDSGVEWLGAIPGDWQHDKCRRVFREINERSLDGAETLLSVSEYYGVKPREDVVDEGEHLSRAESLEDYKKCTRDDLVMNIMLAWKRGLGVSKCAGIVSPAYCVFRLMGNDFPKYMDYLLRTDLYTNQFKRFSTGVIDSRLRLYPDLFKTIDIILPPTQTQIIIATFLDRETAKLDTLIAKQEKLIELLQEKRQAVISHAVTKGLDPDVSMKDSGVEWLGEVPVGWNVKRLKHIKALKPNAFVDGPFGSNLKTEHFILNGDAYVIESNFATQNVLTLSELKTISQEHFETIMRSQTKEGDIIIAKIGAQFGKASILPKIDKPAVVSGNSMKLSVNENLCGNQWAYWQLTNLKAIGEIDLLSNGSAQPALSLGSMNNLPFLLPSISEQALILEYISKETTKIDILIDKAKRSIELAKEHRTALISAAVTGKIDVRNQVPEASYA